jgi:hypothetical protein
MKSAWIKSQKQLARQWTRIHPSESYYQEDFEQAYRLFTLALAGQPEMSAMNRLRERKDLSVQAKWRLAAAYALSGQSQAAKALIGRETTDIQPYDGLYSSYGSRERDWAMILETQNILGNHTQSAVLAKKISEMLSSEMWMSTQTTAYCLLSMAKFSKDMNPGELKFGYKIGQGKQMQASSAKPIIQIPIPVGNSKSGSVTLVNSSTGTLFVRIIMEGIPDAGAEKEFSNNLSLSASYYTLEGDEIDVTRISQGTDFMAVVTIYNPSGIFYKNLALTQIFPPGWEISNSRMERDDLAASDNPEYMDIRDDRIYTYFDLGSSERKTFRVKLNAAYLGKFYLTGVYCEAMYDNSISAMEKGQWIEVTKSGQ